MPTTRRRAHDHWRGGRHSELRVRKPRSGEHGCARTEDALAAIRSMAGRWSDEHIAAWLNRMGMPTAREDVDGASRLFGSSSPQHPCLPVCRERWRMVDHDRGGGGLGGYEPQGPATHQGRGVACRAGRSSRPIKAEPKTLLRPRFNPRWPERIARVALPTPAPFQCLQTFDERLHNATCVARSAAPVPPRCWSGRRGRHRGAEGNARRGGNRVNVSSGGAWS